MLITAFTAHHVSLFRRIDCFAGSIRMPRAAGATPARSTLEWC